LQNEPTIKISTCNARTSTISIYGFLQALPLFEGHYLKNQPTFLILMKIDSDEPGNFFRNLLLKKEIALKIKILPKNLIPKDLRCCCKRESFFFPGFKRQTWKQSCPVFCLTSIRLGPNRCAWPRGRGVRYQSVPPGIARHIFP